MKGKANGIKELKTKFLDEKRSRQGFYNHLHKKRNLNRKEVVESWSAAEGCCIFRSLSAAAVSLPPRTRAQNKSEYLHRLHEDGHPPVNVSRPDLDCPRRNGADNPFPGGECKPRSG